MQFDSKLFRLCESFTRNTYTNPIHNYHSENQSTMTQMQQREIRKKSKLQDAEDDWNGYSEDDESDDDGPGAHNSTTIRPLSPTPRRFEIPARYLPLLRAVREATPFTMSDANWDDVENCLNANHSIALLGIIDHEEYLKEAKRENMPVMYNTDRTGKILKVWTLLPLQWVHPNATANERNNLNGTNAPPLRRINEHRHSLKILHGPTNITADIVKAVLHLSKRPNDRIPATYVVEQMVADQLVTERPAHCMPIVVKHVIHVLRPRGLLIDSDERGNVWVLEGLEVDRSQLLRETFRKHLIGQSTYKRAKVLIEKDFWEEDPNIFLLFHTTNFVQLVEHARNTTDCVKMTAGDIVSWIE